MSAPRNFSTLSPLATGLACKCPRCGRGRIFCGLLNVCENCAHCDLDLTPHDTGDGAIVFVILILGAIVVGLAIWLETVLEPPLWVHLVVWIPLITIFSIGMLRVFKAVLIGMHYKNLRHKYIHGNGG
jgi:uncharacterized protein (DUF983 family)